MDFSYFNFAYETLQILRNHYATRLGLGDKTVQKDYFEVVEAMKYLEEKRR